MKVLIVEDEAASLKLATLVLCSEGHDVTDARTAELAIGSIAQSQPEVILLDLGLPGMDGLALARKLKEDPKTQHIPIIALTAYPERFPREEARRAGCVDYILKPIDTRKLPARVKAAAQQQNQNSK